MIRAWRTTSVGPEPNHQPLDPRLLGSRDGASGQLEAVTQSGVAGQRAWLAHHGIRIAGFLAHQ
jgi:hypothetical protein